MPEGLICSGVGVETLAVVGVGSGVGVGVGSGVSVGSGIGVEVGVSVAVGSSVGVAAGCSPLSHADRAVTPSRHSRPIHVILWTILRALIGARFGCWMGMPPPVANIAKLDMLARFFRNRQRGTSIRIHDCRTYFILTANRVRVLRRLSPIRAYSVNLNLRVKVLDFVQFGGPARVRTWDLPVMSRPL